MNNFFGFAFHFEFGNPKGGLSDDDGEIIYLNAVKILDRNFNGIVEFAERDLTAEKFGSVKQIV